MNHPGDNSENFSNEEFWELLDQSIDGFHEEASKEPATIDLEELLPSTDSPYRLKVLTALIKMDLERQWKRSNPAFSEDYFRNWPEIESKPDLAYEIVESECRSRAVFDQAPDIEEIKKRFPQFARRLDVESKMVNDGEDVLQHSFLGSFLRGSGRVPPKPSYEEGQMLGRYRVDAVVEQGGMGTVYRAFDIELERQVAIKVLHGNLDISDRVQQLLIEEARLTAKLNHPGIVPVYDVGQADDGQLFFVMEFVSGEPLSSLLGQGPLPETLAKKIVIQVSDAVAFAHANGVIHRDIKPANIIIDPNGNAKITDFGLALPADVTESNGTSGTLPYMAPEQLKDDSNASKEKGDVWALGVLLFETLTGKRPFAGKTSHSLLRSIESRSPIFRPTDGIRISKKLERICNACLQIDPAKRVLTASELANQLRLTDRKPIVKVTMLVIATIALVATGWYSWVNRPFSPPPDSVLASIETCPELKNCGIVFVVHTGCNFDLPALRDYIAAHHATIMPPNWFKNDSASFAQKTENSIRLTSDWLSWTAPFAYYSITGEARAAELFPDKTSLEVTFALGKNGTIQIGTSSPLAEEQLMVLAQTTGLDNYTDFHGEILTGSKADQVNAVDSRTVLGPKNNALAIWSSLVYQKLFHHGNLITRGPQNRLELYQCPMEIRNYFDHPITVVRGLGYHLQYDVDEFNFKRERYFRDEAPARIKSEQNSYNLWSPMPYERSDGKYRFQLNGSLEYSLRQASALVLVASVDDDPFPGIRNSAAVTATGMDDRIPFWPSTSDTKWIHQNRQTESINLDAFLSATTAKENEEETQAIIIDRMEEDGVLTCAVRRYVGASTAMIYNRFPSEINIECYSRYSVVRPEFRLATFGEVNIRSESRAFELTESGQSPLKDKRKIAHDKFVFRPFAK